MTADEKRLLLLIANAVVEIEDDIAAKHKTTSNISKEIRHLVTRIRES